MRLSLLLLLPTLLWAQDCDTISFVDKTFTGHNAYSGMDPSGTYVDDPEPFIIDERLVIELDINKEYSCSDHYFVLSSTGTWLDWAWASAPDRISVGWNCDELYIYHPDSSQTVSTPSSTLGIHHVTIVYTPTSLTVSTDKTPVDLSVTGTFWSTAWVWTGADDDESRGSDLAAVTFGCSDGESVPDIGCVGAYGACDAECTKIYHISTHQSGEGSGCPFAEGETADCAHGEGACPSNIDCVGAYGACDAGCTKTYHISTLQSGEGSECPFAEGETADCAHGEGACPSNIDCVGAYGACDEGCTKIYHISTLQSGEGSECPFGEGETADCAHGEGTCPMDCTVNTLTAISLECFCGASTSACGAGQFCYDDACHVDASHHDCDTETDRHSAYDPVIHECGCAGAEICDPGRFCYAGTCNNNAHCQRPDNIDKGVFYGAKILGMWDQPLKTMHMRLPIPGYFSLDEIKWVDAQDGTVLSYHDTNHGSWEIDDTDECMIVYELNVGQDMFFGPGSRFHINGHQMKAAIDVDVHTHITRVHQGHSYQRDRHVSNMLPVLVNLVPVTDVSVIFHTDYALPGQEEEGPMKSVVIRVACGDIEDEVLLLQECQTTYGDPAILTCYSVECSPEGFTQVNFEGEADGSQQGAIEDLIAYIVDNDWTTATHGPYDCENGPHVKLEPDEFIIFLEAHENVLVDDDPTITIRMETHSRGCVDHTTANGGVQVEDASKAWVEADTVQIYDWEMNSETGEVAFEYEWNLCVEILEWTFTPLKKSDGTYEINLVFDQKEGLPSFIATAEITIAKSDVLGEVGFDTEITLWEDVDTVGVPFNENYKFQIGERFWAKIELSSLIVDADNIDCTEFIVTQYPEEADVGIDPAIDGGVHDMMNNDVYKFQNHATTLPNTAIFGAELEVETFYLSVGGVKSELTVGLSITYKQGTQENVRLRRMLHGNSKWMETAVGEDDGTDYASMDREPEERSLSLTFDILGRAENMVGVMIRQMTAHPKYTGVLFVGIGAAVAAALSMNSFGSKSSVQAYLLDEEF